MNFWHTLKKPILALAPMADVTDPAYRRLIAEIAKPDVTWTEFVSADGLFHTRTRGIFADEENPLVRDLTYTESERPIVAQLFTSNPDTMRYAALYAREKGFDGVDINMGCPDRSIEKQGAGAAHMKDPARARDVIRAAIEGAAGLPVSVKTRIGYNAIAYDAWLPEVLKEDISALTVHLRTRKEMSKVDAHWELADDIRKLVRVHRPDIKLLMNGDVMSRAEAMEKIGAHEIDGVMMGRAIFGNPWLFADAQDHTHHERVRVFIRLARYFGDLQPRKSASILKKHIKAFFRDTRDAGALRERLYAEDSVEGLLRTLEKELS